MATRPVLIFLDKRLLDRIDAERAHPDLSRSDWLAVVAGCFLDKIDALGPEADRWRQPPPR